MSTSIGSLCGECVNDSAVGVLRTNCRNCTSDNYYALGFLGESNSHHTHLLITYLIPLPPSLFPLSYTSPLPHPTAVADVIAVGAILFLSVKLHRAFPHSLKGLLFYIQVRYMLCSRVCLCVCHKCSICATLILCQLIVSHLGKNYYFGNTSFEHLQYMCVCMCVCMCMCMCMCVHIYICTYVWCVCVCVCVHVPQSSDVVMVIFIGQL